jgi:hypothetical protein
MCAFRNAASQAVLPISQDRGFVAGEVLMTIQGVNTNGWGKAGWL